MVRSILLHLFKLGLDQLRKHLENKNERMKLHKHQLEEEAKELAIESQEHKDLLFLDLVDQYGSLPLKNILSFSWYCKPNITFTANFVSEYCFCFFKG